MVPFFHEADKPVRLFDLGPLVVGVDKAKSGAWSLTADNGFSKTTMRLAVNNVEWDGNTALQVIVGPYLLVLGIP